MEFIDSHCHLDFAKIGVVEAALAQASKNGVSHFVVPSVGHCNWQHVLSLSLDYAQIHAALGVHPYFIEQDNKLSLLSALATKHREQIVAIGEIGLDGAIDTPLDSQLSTFTKQIELAKELALPVICHAHKAYDPLLKQLRHYQLACGGVIHGFSGSLVQAKEFIKLGFKLGVGGVITYERAKKTRKVFSDIGLDHLILETDAPDMPIYGKQGQPNAPENIPIIARALADVTQQPIEDVAKITTQNTKSLFNL